jgi:hypothetical protein
MKKILAYVSPEEQASLFDLIVAYDSGADVVVPYTGMTAEDMRDTVHSCVFTRHPDDLKNTAVFIGGHDVDKGEGLMNAILEAFKELPDIFRVSVAVDPDGAYTTSSACVVKIKALQGNLSKHKATILAGTGPVGQRIAVLLSREGCDVTLTSRKLDRALDACRVIKERYEIGVKAFEASNEETTMKAVSDSDIVVTTGPEGVQVLPKKIWSKSTAKVMADVNAVPPYGIEGVDVRDDCREIEKDRIGIGALAIGGLKMKCHHVLVNNLFKEKGVVFDLDKVYEIAESI